MVDKMPILTPVVDPADGITVDEPILTPVVDPADGITVDEPILTPVVDPADGIPVDEPILTPVVDPADGIPVSPVDKPVAPSDAHIAGATQNKTPIKDKPAESKTLGQRASDVGLSTAVGAALGIGLSPVIPGGPVAGALGGGVMGLIGGSFQEGAEFLGFQTPIPEIFGFVGGAGASSGKVVAKEIPHALGYALNKIHEMPASKEALALYEKIKPSIDKVADEVRKGLGAERRFVGEKLEQAKSEVDRLRAEASRLAEEAYNKALTGLEKAEGRFEKGKTVLGSKIAEAKKTVATALRKAEDKVNALGVEHAKELEASIKESKDQLETLSGNSKAAYQEDLKGVIAISEAKSKAGFKITETEKYNELVSGLEDMLQPNQFDEAKHGKDVLAAVRKVLQEIGPEELAKKGGEAEAFASSFNRFDEVRRKLGESFKGDPTGFSALKAHMARDFYKEMAEVERDFIDGASSAGAFSQMQGKYSAAKDTIEALELKISSKELVKAIESKFKGLVERAKLDAYGLKKKFGNVDPVVGGKFNPALEALTGKTKAAGEELKVAPGIAKKTIAPALNVATDRLNLTQKMFDAATKAESKITKASARSAISGMMQREPVEVLRHIKNINTPEQQKVASEVIQYAMEHSGNSRKFYMEKIEPALNSIGGVPIETMKELKAYSLNRGDMGTFSKILVNALIGESSAITGERLSSDTYDLSSSLSNLAGGNNLNEKKNK
jgi:hypothetical protein